MSIQPLGPPIVVSASNSAQPAVLQAWTARLIQEILEMLPPPSSELPVAPNLGESPLEAAFRDIDRKMKFEELMATRAYERDILALAPILQRIEALPKDAARPLKVNLGRILYLNAHKDEIRMGPFKAELRAVEASVRNAKKPPTMSREERRLHNRARDIEHQLKNLGVEGAELATVQAALGAGKSDRAGFSDIAKVYEEAIALHKQARGCGNEDVAAKVRAQVLRGLSPSSTQQLKALQRELNAKQARTTDGNSGDAFESRQVEKARLTRRIESLPVNVDRAPFNDALALLATSSSPRELRKRAHEVEVQLSRFGA
ncbi:MAG: hypothetical protein ACKVPX_12055 [Myxococcaceae bacterium]